MKRYRSKKIPLPPISGDADSGELIFYGVDRTGPSYEARVFVNNASATADTPTELATGFVGVFTVFGHGGCVGDEGHCAPDLVREDAFDLRLPRGLPPITKTVALSVEALRLFEGEDAFTVSVVAVEPSPDGPRASEACSFDSWRLAVYEP